MTYIQIGDIQNSESEWQLLIRQQNLKTIFRWYQLVIRMAEIDLDRSISVVVRTGKTAFGIRTAIKSAKIRRAKAFIIAENTPTQTKEDLLRYARLSDIPVIIYPKSSLDLGINCGRPHLVSVVTIYDAGDSDILSIAKSVA